MRAMPLDAPHHRVLRALGDTLLPSTGPGDPAGGDVVPAAVDELLSTFPEADVRRVGILLRVFEYGALPGYRRPFSKLPPPQREKYVAGWMTSRIAARRVIYRALRRICMNAYYQAPEVWPSLGYDGPLVGRGERREPPAPTASAGATDGGLR
jgi:hypothetical protein